MTRRIPGLFLALLAITAIAAGLAVTAVADGGKHNEKNFEYAIGVWGDLPYSDVQAQVGVPNLIADMNNQDLEFTVHDGDLKAGNAITGSKTPTDCGEPALCAGGRVP